MLDLQLIQKDLIVETLISWIKEKYPSRTSDYDKCRRDIGLVIDAIIRDLEKNTVSETQHIANKFWSRNKPMLQSNNVELEVYDQLVNLLEVIECRPLLENNTAISNLVDILKNTIKNGPSYREGSWDYICNNRIMNFNWTTQIPEKYLIHRILSDVHEFCPSKQRRVRYNIDVIPTHANLDLKMKIYSGTQADTSNNNSRYNPQVLAPWVLSFSVNEDVNKEKRSPQYYEQEAWLDVGLALQQIMLSSVANGLAVGLCACINNYDEMKLALGRRPIIYAGIGYKSDSLKYFCPIKKTIQYIPSRDHDKKPSIDNYIYYHS